MYSEEDIIRLCEEEDELTEEELLVLLATLSATLSDIEKELRVFFQKYGKDGVVTYAEVKKWVTSKNHTKRLVFLNQTISDIFDHGFTLFEQTFRDHLTDIIKKEADFFGVDIDIDAILNTPWGDDILTGLQRLANKRQLYVSKLNSELKQSILRRDSILDVLFKTSKRGETMEKDLRRLFRTEANAISSLARKQCYILKGYTKYKFIHVDRCECDKCESMHNIVFPIEAYEVGVTANPLHSNCRDRTEPMF